jgi:hypothetical protein
MYSQQYQPSSSTPSTVRSVVREPTESQYANMAMIGIASDTATRKLNRSLFGNYLTITLDESLYGESTSANAMAAQVFNAQGHIVMTATTVKEHAQEATMLAQTGGSSHDSQKFFAQTQPETSEMSTQTEPQTGDCSVHVQQSTHARSRFGEGQEHTGVQCEIDGAVKAFEKAIEMEIYANLLWTDLQRESDQKGFLDGQEHANDMNAEAEMSPVQKTETGTDQYIRAQ